MLPTWHPEFVVDEALAKRLIEEQFPELGAVTLSFLGEGFDNTVYLVNGVWAFRFPRKQIGAELLARELRVVPHIKNHLALPISAPVWRGAASDLFRWQFAGYRFVTGVESCRVGLSDAQREALAPVLGGFLRTLHELPAELVRAIEPPPDTLGKLSIEKRIPVAREAITALVERGVLSEAQRAKLLSLMEETPTSIQEPIGVLVHGDLYSRHILVNESKAITGIIDWGDVHLNHPACDLGLLYCFFPPQVQEVFWRAYGEVSEETRRLSWFRGMYHNALVARYAVDIQDRALVEETQLAFAWLSDLLI